jgi:hypothetical protein
LKYIPIQLREKNKEGVNNDERAIFLSGRI